MNVICAATFLAAIGTIRRFKNPRKLVGYLGLDPKVRQSGSGPGTAGRISKQGSSSGAMGARRSVLERGRCSPARCARSTSASAPAAATRSRSSPPPASSRACSGACSPATRTTPTQQPSLTAKKLRKLELIAGAAPRRVGRRDLVGQPRDARSRKQLADQAEASYREPSATGTPQHQEESGRERDTGARIKRPSKGKAARQTQSP